MPVSVEVLDARILVVDDLEADARLVQALLQAAGFTSIDFVNDPFAACDLHRRHRYDLVILDLLMPGMDGFAVLEELSRIEPDCPVPVIVVTAEPDLMKRALEAGARDFVGKPLSAVELLPRVRNAVQLGMLMRQSHGRKVALEQALHQRTAALEETQERYRVLVEQSIAGIYVIQDDRFSYANPQFCQWLGYTCDELSAMPTIDLVVEEDRPRVLENRRRRDAGDLEAMTATYRLRRKDGEVIHLDFAARLIDLAGKRVVFGMAQNVTEREHARKLLMEAESHYRALVEQSIVGIYLLEGSHVLYANPRLCEMLGYRLDELGRRPLRELVVAEDGPIVEEMARRRDAGETGSIAAQLTVRRKDGSLVHLGLETKIIDLAGAKATLGVVQDMTERKRAHDALQHANSKLRSLSDRILAVQEEERRRISRELHDDLGQSLVALDIGLHRLEPYVAESRRGVLDECIGVTADVREKLREISVDLHPPHLDQLGLQDALRWLVSRQRDLTGMEIQCQVSGVEDLRIPPAVEAACYRICQEALSNAARHAKARGITVELVARDRVLVVRVADDGTGFDPAAQRESLVSSGSMGLISMEERARLAGGRLEVRSAPGAGTSVSAVFPIEARAAQSAVLRQRI